MKIASTVLLIASGAAVLAAVWLPAHWWQFGITALVLLFAAAGTGGAAAKAQPYAKGGRSGPPSNDDSVPVPLRDGQVLSSAGDADLDQALNTRPQITSDDVADYKRREYGQKAGDA